MTTVMEYEFLFVVDGISMEGDSPLAIITEVFDGIVSSNRGLCRVAVSGEGADAVTAAADLAACLMAAVPGLRILRLDPDLVGVADIAQRANRTRQNVQQWVTGTRNLGREFPPPEGCAGQSLVWRWAEINEWLAPLGLSDGETRPSRAESARIDVMLLDMTPRNAECVPPAGSSHQHELEVATGSGTGAWSGSGTGAWRREARR